jgi:hypothetical protein
LAGACAGLCMLAKYWSVFLLVGLVIAALGDPRRWAYFRSAAPWVTIAAGFAVLGPHLIWLSEHDFVSFNYAVAMHVTSSFSDTAGKAVVYLAGAAAFVVIPVGLVLAAVRPRGATVVEMIWPSDRERRLVAVAFWGPLVLPVAAALVGDTVLTPIWSMPAWTLLPVVLLSPPDVKVSPISRQSLLALAVAVPLVMLIAAPAIALAIHRAGVTPPAAHGRLLAAETERAWRQATSAPLRVVGCDVADEVIAYARDRPHALPWRSFHGDVADDVYADAHNWPSKPRGAPELGDAQLAESGMALVCLADSADWVEAAAAKAAGDPASRRVDVELTRNFLGIAGRPQRYVIFIIPPQH